MVGIVEAILVLAAVASFIASVGFIIEVYQIKMLRRIVGQIENRLAILIPDGSTPGQIAADMVICLMNDLQEKGERGDKARAAFGGLFTFMGAAAFDGIRGKADEGIGGTPVDKLPKKYRDGIGLLQIVKDTLASNVEKQVVEVVETGLEGWK